MLMLKKDVETEMKDVLQLLCEIDPVTRADLGCQFPNHEKLLASIRSCAKLVLRKCKEVVVSGPEVFTNIALVFVGFRHPEAVLSRN